MDLKAIDVQTTHHLFTSLAELQGYDTVILADIARSSGGAGKRRRQFQRRPGQDARPQHRTDGLRAGHDRR